MPISLLRINDFRNLAMLEISPFCQGLNVVCGNNGSGKTSLLEAIYYLGSGRSLRGSTSIQLIRHQANKFSVFAQLMNENGQITPLGIERHLDGNVQLRMSERPVPTISELARFLPIRVINTHSHYLFESGPVFRRKFLDWGLFYQSNHFFACWQQFERALKQRNAALREKRSKKELDSWTKELIKYGLELDGLRQAYTETLIPVLKKVVSELISLPDLTISYQSGWSAHQDYSTVLANHYDEDLRAGYTQYGPHRADLDITIQGVSIKHILSRGQQKLLICAMILAQGMLLVKCENTGLIYLVDDLPSELDLQSREKLISLLSRQKTQVFITVIEYEAICGLITNKSEVPTKVFHVEHGRIL